MADLQLSRIEKMSRKELKLAIENCFEHAPETSPVDRLAILQEAQFYTRELERRSDSLVSIRDLVLEILVIVLIGWEIHMSYRAEHLQTQNFQIEEQVFTNLEKSSDATAKTLAAEQSTMEGMNTALQRQLALYYDVSVAVIFNQDKKRMTFVNQGRTNVVLMGTKFFDDPPVFEPLGRNVQPNGAYEIDAAPQYAKVEANVPKGKEGLVPFDIYIKNEQGEEFVEHCFFGISWEALVASRFDRPAALESYKS
jgi:hypothetical protein